MIIFINNMRRVAYSITICVYNSIIAPVVSTRWIFIIPNIVEGIVSVLRFWINGKVIKNYFLCHAHVKVVY